ncbi:DUF4097 family beta strand repeat-containing protein [Lactobacillus corticis]|uniref:Adhesin domain-containing protein n=1 Tax=Lactobacillus corticis TaxID=2201249 RepID=A0A916QJX6_9LACO|nr:DUF4097 family beta strand repeat-containing protein [Lactobacillus corticis]GFZ26710.1 hypothetical protein LCB40_05900 [Lactobacillus corticis]
MKAEFSLGKVRVKLVNGLPGVRFGAGAARTDFEISQTNDSLKIKQVHDLELADDAMTLRVINEPPHLLVSLPIGTYLNLTCKLGAIVANGFTCCTSRIELGAGVVSLIGLQTEKIQAQVDDGIIRVSHSLIAQKASLTVKNGMLLVKDSIRSEQGYNASCDNGVLRCFGNFELGNKHHVTRPGKVIWQLCCDSGILNAS